MQELFTAVGKQRVNEERELWKQEVHKLYFQLVS